MDPPYHQNLERITLEKLAGMKYITEDTLLVTEAALDTDFSYLEGIGFTIVKEKKYKTNKHVFIQRKADE